MNPSERVRECMDQEGVPVRYSYSIPDEETLHRLIDYPNSLVPPYLFAVFLNFGVDREIAFGDARRHHEMVKAIEQEKGKHVCTNGAGMGDWTQIQIDLERRPQVRFSKIVVVGSFGEGDVMLLLGRINPGLFAGKTEVVSFTTSARYIYDPINGDLQRAVRGIQGDEIRPLGRVQISPIPAQ